MRGHVKVAMAEYNNEEQYYQRSRCFVVMEKKCRCRDLKIISNVESKQPSEPREIWKQLQSYYWLDPIPIASIAAWAWIAFQ